MILVIDNYDSFVFNVARYLARLGAETEVLRNDRLTLAEVKARSPRAIILSPGPCTPQEAGISLDVVRELSGIVPILGVCLGHQVIGEAFGGLVERAQRPLHGRSSRIRHEGVRLFEGLADPMEAGRYHSLIVTATPAMQRHLIIDAVSEEGEIMALSHRLHPTFGIQFHPESVLTQHGSELFANFLQIAERWHADRLA